MVPVTLFLEFQLKAKNQFREIVYDLNIEIWLL